MLEKHRSKCYVNYNKCIQLDVLSFWWSDDN